MDRVRSRRSESHSFVVQGCTSSRSLLMLLLSSLVLAVISYEPEYSVHSSVSGHSSLYSSYTSATSAPYTDVTAAGTDSSKVAWRGRRKMQNTSPWFSLQKSQEGNVTVVGGNTPDGTPVPQVTATNTKYNCANWNLNVTSTVGRVGMKDSRATAQQMSSTIFAEPVNDTVVGSEVLLQGQPLSVANTAMSGLRYYHDGSLGTHNVHVALSCGDPCAVLSVAQKSLSASSVFDTTVKYVSADVWISKDGALVLADGKSVKQTDGTEKLVCELNKSELGSVQEPVPKDLATVVKGLQARNVTLIGNIMFGCDPNAAGCDAASYCHSADDTGTHASARMTQSLAYLAAEGVAVSDVILTSDFDNVLTLAETQSLAVAKTLWKIADTVAAPADVITTLQPSMVNSTGFAVITTSSAFYGWNNIATLKNAGIRVFVDVANETKAASLRSIAEVSGADVIQSSEYNEAEAVAYRESCTQLSLVTATAEYGMTFEADITAYTVACSATLLKPGENADCTVTPTVAMESAYDTYIAPGDLQVSASKLVTFGTLTKAAGGKGGFTFTADPGTSNETDITVSLYGRTSNVTLRRSDVVSWARTELTCNTFRVYASKMTTCTLATKDKSGRPALGAKVEDFVVAASSPFNTASTTEVVQTSPDTFTFEVGSVHAVDVNVTATAVQDSAAVMFVNVAFAPLPGAIDMSQSQLSCSPQDLYPSIDVNCTLTLKDKDGLNAPWAQLEDMAFTFKGNVTKVMKPSTPYGDGVTTDTFTLLFTPSAVGSVQLAAHYNGTDTSKSWDFDVTPVPGAIVPSKTEVFCEPNPALVGQDVLCTITTFDTDGIKAVGATPAEFDVHLLGGTGNLTNVVGSGSTFQFVVSELEPGSYSITLGFRDALVNSLVVVSEKPGAIEPGMTLLSCNPNPTTTIKAVTCTIITKDKVNLDATGATVDEFQVVPETLKNYTLGEVVGGGPTFSVDIQFSEPGVYVVSVKFRGASVRSSVIVQLPPGQLVVANTEIVCSPNPVVANTVVTCRITTNDNNGNPINAAKADDFDIEIIVAQNNVTSIPFKVNVTESTTANGVYLFSFTAVSNGTIGYTMAFGGEVFNQTIPITSTAGAIDPERTTLVCDPVRVFTNGAVTCKVTTRDSGGNNAAGSKPEDVVHSVEGNVVKGSVSDLFPLLSGSEYIFTFQVGQIGVVSAIVEFQNVTSKTLINIFPRPGTIVPEHTIVTCSPSPVTVGDPVTCRISTKDVKGEYATGANAWDFEVALQPPTARYDEPVSALSASDFEFVFTPDAAGQVIVSVTYNGGVTFRLIVKVQEAAKIQTNNNSDDLPPGIVAAIFLGVTAFLVGMALVYKYRDVIKEKLNIAYYDLDRFGSVQTRQRVDSSVDDMTPQPYGGDRSGRYEVNGNGGAYESAMGGNVNGNGGGRMIVGANAMPSMTGGFDSHRPPPPETPPTVDTLTPATVDTQVSQGSSGNGNAVSETFPQPNVNFDVDFDSIDKDATVFPTQP
eukprot:GFYU01005440.1.p1 GENE.GFYU01005440.1~~GFYU01005440.1.p1  ORF type:complete len:1498 (-),score=374.00 GFYU01005440.1:49-4542(-)